MDYLKSQDISDLSSSKIAKLIEKKILRFLYHNLQSWSSKMKVLDSIPDDGSNEDVPIIEQTKSDKTRQLSIEQQNWDQLLQGKSDSTTAETVGVPRQELLEWRNHDPHFISELNRQRSEMWKWNLREDEAFSKTRSRRIRATALQRRSQGFTRCSQVRPAGNHLFGDTSLSQGGPTIPEDVILVELRSEARKELAPEIKRKSKCSI